jgi:hypothetical protein
MTFIQGVKGLSPVDELRDIGRKIEENAKKATEVTKMVDEAKKGVIKALDEAKEQARKLNKVVDWLKALWDKIRPWLIAAVVVFLLVMIWPLFTLLSTIRAALGGLVSLAGLDAPPR